MEEYYLVRVYKLDSKDVTSEPAKFTDFTFDDKREAMAKFRKAKYAEIFSADDDDMKLIASTLPE